MIIQDDAALAVQGFMSQFSVESPWPSTLSAGRRAEVDGWKFPTISNGLAGEALFTSLS